MPKFSIQRTYEMPGKSFPGFDQLTTESMTLMDNVTLDAALPAVLTTRTNGTQGVITAEGGHGIESGTLDVYFPGGCRYGVTATVDVNAITITGGTGDDLPVATTALSLFVPVSEVFSVPAESAQVILVRSPNGQMVTRFRTAVPAVALAVVQTSAGQELYSWDVNHGGANPLGANAIATLLLSHGGLEAIRPEILVAFSTA